ncbi:RNA-dependent RNA polymerase [Botrytis cinerea partitivirus 3]|nr:RNA-dependent RNA polymerase [Botrytis cinerea partitivirus 3]
MNKNVIYDDPVDAVEPFLGDNKETFLLWDASSSSRSRVTANTDFIEQPGLKEIARYGGYSTYSAPGNTDPWVRLALKIHDRERYDRIYGFTRRPAGLEGMYKALFRFGEQVNEFKSLSFDQRNCMRSAIKSARSAFRLPVKHEPLEWEEVGQYMRHDTSAGVTFPGKKKGEVAAQIYTEARWLGHRMKQGGKERFDPRKVRFPPCLAAQRGHLSPRDDPKTRLTWIYPAEMLVIEGLWAPVMYHQFMSLPNGPMLCGKSSQRLYTEWIVNYREGEKLHGLDFSAFDSSVPQWLIRTAFDILHQNVDWLNWRGKPTTKRSRQKWRNVWDGMVWYFINTPILMPDGRMFRKRRGVPSGTWFTSLVDSVVNYIIVEYLTKCQQVEAKNLKVLGDDSAFRSGRALDLEQSQKDADVLGMNLNVKKCDVTEDPTEFKLLGTTYRNQRAHREDDDWFKLLLYPENPPPDIGTSLSRLVGLWIGGAMWSHEFCRFMTFYQSCYECPTDGTFTKDQRRWLEIIHGGSAPRGWTSKKSLFWRSIFYTI